VPAVLGTLWAVDDDSTATLVRSCYERMLTEGVSAGAALRAAQLALAAGDDDARPRHLGDADAAPAPLSRSHPYFWAGFVATGAADVVGVSASSGPSHR
jgi:CHAT domain-containing protein